MISSFKWIWNCFEKFFHRNQYTWLILIYKGTMIIHGNKNVRLIIYLKIKLLNVLDLVVKANLLLFSRPIKCTDSCTISRQFGEFWRIRIRRWYTPRLWHKATSTTSTCRFVIIVINIQWSLTYPGYSLMQIFVWDPISISQHKVTHLSGNSVIRTVRQVTEALQWYCILLFKFILISK